MGLFLNIGDPKPNCSHKKSSDKSIKLPEYIEASPLTWWLTCESVFESWKVVKPVDRYHHLVAALPSTVTMKLLDVLTFQAEDEGEKLTFLKTRLMELYAPLNSLTGCPAFQLFNQDKSHLPCMPISMHFFPMTLVMWMTVSSSG